MQSSELLGRIADSIHAGRSYGPAIEHDGCVVVPVAYVFGGGGGGGRGTARQGAEPTGADHEHSGGGFGYVSWPIGVFVIRDGDVHWRPVIDVGGLVMFGAGLIRAMRPRRRRAKTLSK